MLIVGWISNGDREFLEIATVGVRELIPQVWDSVGYLFLSREKSNI
jgi:hypothetical protein